VSDLQNTEYSKLFHTVDVFIEKNDKIVICVRGQEPFKGLLELPGGHIEENETVEETAIREAKEETGLDVKLKEIMGVYSEPKRDPRGPTVTTVFVAEPVSGELKAASDVKDANWVQPEKIDFKKLGFDHVKILQDYLRWKKSKGTYWSTR
jgi:8-oxo-dGTP diphosphatase